MCLSLCFFSCSKKLKFDHDPNLSFTENLQDLADKLVDKGIPGIVLLVDDPKNGLNIIEAGYANIETKDPITKEHLFHSASLMKPYTASCIFLLQEAGLLSIEDKIAEHLDTDVISNIPNGELATIKSILTHTSGIPDFADQSDYLEDLIAFTEGGTEPNNVISYIKDLEPDFTFGSKVNYCNTGYYILSQIIEAISGQDFEIFLNENIFQTLELENSIYKNKPRIVDYNEVPDYYIDWKDNGKLSLSTNLENKATQTFEGFSGLLADVNDFYKFYKALLHDKKLLSAESIDQMMTITHTSNFGYGQGLEVILSNKYPDKYGHKGGTQASSFYYPDEETIIISLINYSFNEGNSPYDQLAIAKDKIGEEGNLIGEIEKCLFD